MKTPKYFSKNVCPINIKKAIPTVTTEILFRIARIFTFYVYMGLVEEKHTFYPQLLVELEPGDIYFGY